MLKVPCLSSNGCKLQMVKRDSHILVWSDSQTWKLTPEPVCFKNQWCTAKMDYVCTLTWWSHHGFFFNHGYGHCIPSTMFLCSAHWVCVLWNSHIQCLWCLHDVTFFTTQGGPSCMSMESCSVCSWGPTFVQTTLPSWVQTTLRFRP